MGKISKWLRSISDDVLVYLATLAGVVASIVWPWIVDGAINGTVPTFGVADVVRIVCASLIGIVLSWRADTNAKNGEPGGRMTKAAIRRRMKAALSRGFAWQAGVAALTAAVAGGG